MDRLADAPLPDLVRWTGAAAAALLVVGPATLLAAGGPAPSDAGSPAFLLAAFGPGATAAAAAGVGYLRVSRGDRARAWPALAALALAVLLPLGFVVL